MPDRSDCKAGAAECAYNFGGIPSAGAAARYSVLPVPYDLTTSYVTGTRNGPRAIIEASTHMELFDVEFGCEPCDAGIDTLPSVEPTALGPGEMIKRVRAAVGGITSRNREGIPVILGGEHSLTLGAVESLLELYPDLSVLQLDAHADMRDEYMDSPFNHACVARRISDPQGGNVAPDFLAARLVYKMMGFINAALDARG